MRRWSTSLFSGLVIVWITLLAASMTAQNLGGSPKARK